MLEKQTQNVFLEKCSLQVAIFKDKYSSVIGTSGIGEAMVDFIEWFHSSDFGKR